MASMLAMARVCPADEATPTAATRTVEANGIVYDVVTFSGPTVRETTENVRRAYGPTVQVDPGGGLAKTVGKIFDPMFYAKPQPAEVIGSIDLGQFNRPPPAGRGVLDLPIKVAGSGEIHIPVQLEFLKEAIYKAIAAEAAINPKFNEKSFVYVTFDRMFVRANESLRGTKTHIDGMLDSAKKEITERFYVASTDGGTRVFPNPLGKDFQDAMQGFDPKRDNLWTMIQNYLDRQTVPPAEIRTKPGEILAMSGETLHSGSAVSQDGWRAFIRITVSDQDYTGSLLNSVNPAFQNRPSKKYIPNGMPLDRPWCGSATCPFRGLRCGGPPPLPAAVRNPTNVLRAKFDGADTVYLDIDTMETFWEDMGPGRPAGALPIPGTKEISPVVSLMKQVALADPQGKAVTARHTNHLLQLQEAAKFNPEGKKFDFAKRNSSFGESGPHGNQPIPESRVFPPDQQHLVPHLREADGKLTLAPYDIEAHAEQIRDPNVELIFEKSGAGINPRTGAPEGPYSIATNPRFHQAMDMIKPKRYVIWGVCTDFCVDRSLIDVLQRRDGAEVIVIADGIAGSSPEKSSLAIEDWRKRGVKLMSAHDYLAEYRPELLKTAGRRPSDCGASFQELANRLESPR
jgi:hypothetical protein